MTIQTYIPALGHDSLTHLYDPAMATVFQERLFRSALIDALDFEPGQQVLDVGCGTGTLSLLLHQHPAGLSVVGLDIDPAVLTIAQQKGMKHNLPLTLSQATANRLPFASSSFDHVLSSLMLHHLSTVQKKAMLTEIGRVLRPNAIVSILDFGPPRSQRLASLLAMLATRFEHADENLRGHVPRFLTEAGFVDVQVRDVAFGGFLKLYQGRNSAHSGGGEKQRDNPTSEHHLTKEESDESRHLHSIRAAGSASAPGGSQACSER